MFDMLISFRVLDTALVATKSLQTLTARPGKVLHINTYDIVTVQLLDDVLVARCWMSNLKLPSVERSFE